MSYKIGEVAKLLDISVDTIRFYEKENILNPHRKNDSKYRIYETWDLFFLMECLKYRSMNFSVKDISQVIHKESMEYYTKKLQSKRDVLREEIKTKLQLDSYMEKYQQKIETAVLNKGNFWFQKTPAKYYISYTTSHNDIYQDIDKNQKLFPVWLKYFPFVEFGQNISREIVNNIQLANQCEWSLVIEKKYADLMKIPLDDSVKTIPEQLCLMTIVDAGNKGDMTDSLLKPALQYIKHSSYQISGDILGNLLVRTHEKNQFCRYLEMMIPVEKRIDS